jgi:uncharacterized protein YjlB
MRNIEAAMAALSRNVASTTSAANRLLHMQEPWTRCDDGDLLFRSIDAIIPEPPVSFVFPDDGLVPNSPLPFLLYKGAIQLDGDPEKSIEDLFAANGWGQMWRNGIYDYLHYHATVHEALAIARGRALVRFGGNHGEEFELRKGDVAILPAGTGHQCLSASNDLVVIGAYPPGAPMQITRPTPENYRLAIRVIPQVAVPETDPVYGQDGPLVGLWKKNRR